MKMTVSDYSRENSALLSWIGLESTPQSSHSAASPGQPVVHAGRCPDLLQPLRQWLDRVEINDVELAHRICRLIPSQCPFERDVKVLGRTVLHIPPLCKLNPLYEEVVGLRFRALCYLADVCGEDISQYC